MRGDPTASAGWWRRAPQLAPVQQQMFRYFPLTPAPSPRTATWSCFSSLSAAAGTGSDSSSANSAIATRPAASDVCSFQHVVRCMVQKPCALQGELVFPRPTVIEDGSGSDTSPSRSWAPWSVSDQPEAAIRHIELLTGRWRQAGEGRQARTRV